MGGLKFEKFTIDKETNRINADFMVEILRKRVLEINEEIKDIPTNGIESLSGDNVDNTDPKNPVVTEDTNKLDKGSFTGDATDLTPNGGYTGTAEDLKNDIDGAISGFRGTISTTDPTPTVDGVYKPQDEGAYPNGLSYNPSTTDANKIVYFILSGGVWTKDDSVTVQSLELSQTLDPQGTTKAPSEKAVADFYDSKTSDVIDIKVGELIDGIYIAAGDGTEGVSSNYKSTKLLDVSDVDYIEVVSNGLTYNTITSPVFYLPNGDYFRQDSIIGNDPNVTHIIKVPRNCKYFRTSILKTVIPDNKFVCKLYKRKFKTFEDEFIKQPLLGDVELSLGDDLLVNKNVKLLNTGLTTAVNDFYTSDFIPLCPYVDFFNNYPSSGFGDTNIAFYRSENEADFVGAIDYHIRANEDVLKEVVITQDIRFFKVGRRMTPNDLKTFRLKIDLKYTDNSQNVNIGLLNDDIRKSDELVLNESDLKVKLFPDHTHNYSDLIPCKEGDYIVYFVNDMFFYDSNYNKMDIPFTINETTRKDIVPNGVSFVQVKYKTTTGKPFHFRLVNKGLIERIELLSNRSDFVVKTWEKGDMDSISIRQPSLCITNNNVILCAAHLKFTGSVADAGAGAYGVVRSLDGGKTWVDKQIVFNHYPAQPLSDCGTGTFIVDTSNNRVWMFSNLLIDNVNEHAFTIGATAANSDYLVKYSDDDGKTWTSEVSLKSLYPAGCNAILSGYNQGICMKNGYLVIPATVVYGGGVTTAEERIIISKDNGATWELSNAASVNYGNEAHVAEYEDNKIMLQIRGIGTKKLVYVSDDFGDTWTQPAEFVDSFPENLQTAGTQACIQRAQIYAQAEPYSAYFGNDDNTYIGLSTRPFSRESRGWVGLEVSRDWKKWVKIYVAEKRQTWGYSALACRNGMLCMGTEPDAFDLYVHIIPNVLDEAIKVFSIIDAQTP